MKAFEQRTGFRMETMRLVGSCAIPVFVCVIRKAPYSLIASLQPGVRMSITLSTCKSKHMYHRLHSEVCTSISLFS